MALLYENILFAGSVPSSLGLTKADSLDAIPCLRAVL
jgi:hypothetical protein